MDQQLSAVLNALLSCSLEEFEEGADRYIDHIVLKDGIKGQGYLLLSSKGGRSFIVQVKESDSHEEQLITFLHEIFHIPLIVLGFVDFEGKLHEEVEQRLDFAAKSFLRKHRLAVEEKFKKLLKAPE